MKTDAAKRCNKTITISVWTLRIVIGAVFIFSGFVKAIDLWGFIFKFEDYMDVAGIVLPRSVTFVMTMTISGFEFVGGILLLSGAYKRVIPWLLTLMMAVMLPLTFYLYIANPIDDCGCFGDAWKLSNGATFLKNVIITAALIFLIIYNKKVSRCVFYPAAQWLEVVVSIIYIVLLGLVCYNVQPLIDFRPYPEGRSLTEPTEDDDDSSHVIFRYANGDETCDFTSDNLPSDTTWKFVERIEPDKKSVFQSMFAIYDGDEDVTEEIIVPEGRQFLLVIPEMSRADISYTYFINELYRLATAHDISFTGLLATDNEGIEYWRDISMADYDCYTVEDTSLKELVRGKMALVYLKDGTIKWKRTVSSFSIEQLIDAENNFGNEFPEHLVEDNRTTLTRMTASFLITLVILWIIQMAVARYYSRQKNKKDKEKDQPTEQDRK